MFENQWSKELPMSSEKGQVTSTLVGGITEEHFELRIWSIQVFKPKILSQEGISWLHKNILITAFVSDEGALVDCIIRDKLCWQCSMIKDEQLYSFNNIICMINVPKTGKNSLFLN